MKVSICIPWIRKDKLDRCLKSIEENSGMLLSEYEIIIKQDVNRIGCPKMLKELVRNSSGDMIMFLGDDTIPQKNFLKNAIQTMNRFEGKWGLVGLNDGTGRTLPTHWLAHKRLLQELDGEFFNTNYWHCYCDNELWDRCREIGRYKFSKSSLVMHDHPLINKGTDSDDDYNRVYSEGWVQHDRWLYEMRKEHNWQTRILVIGNGASYLKMEGVPLADYDKVVRINEWERLDTMDNRCDAWVVYPLHHIGYPNSENLFDIVKWSEYTNDMWLVHPFTLPYFVDIFNKKPDFMLTEEQRINFVESTGIEVPVTGVLALYLALQIPNAQVYAVGFDFYQGDRMYYYNNEKPTGEIMHPHGDPLIEKAWFDEQVKEGRIIPL